MNMESPRSDDHPAIAFPERVAYDACPLCGASDFELDRVADCSRHPSWKPPLSAKMTWNRCNSCEHGFVDGHFTPEARAILSDHVPAALRPGDNIEGNRKLSSLIVDKVLARKSGGRWLDVGFGNGSLLFTAEEYGFEVLGLDQRLQAVEELTALGVRARCTDLCDVADIPLVDVVSMSDHLLSAPYPQDTLRAAYRALAPDGVLFLSVPNTETLLWNRWTAQNTNPYWAEIWHHHNFGRRRLFATLEDIGFDRLQYGVSARFRCGMEVLAQKPAN